MIQGKNLVKIIIDTNDSITPAAKKAADDYLAALHEAGGKMAKQLKDLRDFQQGLEAHRQSSIIIEVGHIFNLKDAAALAEWEAANK